MQSFKTKPAPAAPAAPAKSPSALLPIKPSAKVTSPPVAKPTAPAPVVKKPVAAPKPAVVKPPPAKPPVQASASVLAKKPAKAALPLSASVRAIPPKAKPPPAVAAKPALSASTPPKPVPKSIAPRPVPVSRPAMLPPATPPPPVRSAVALSASHLPPRPLSPSASPPFPMAGGLPPPLPSLEGVLGWDFGAPGPREPFPDPAPGQAFLEADKIDYHNKNRDIRAEGQARFAYREMSLSAPLVYVHESREILYAKGKPVDLVFRGHTLYTKRLHVDFLKRTLKARGGVTLKRRAPQPAEQNLSASAPAENQDDEPLVQAIKKRATRLVARSLDVTWAEGEGFLSASGKVLVEQPKWRLTSGRLWLDEKDAETHAVGDVVLRLSDSRWLIDEDVLPGTKLSRALQDDPVILTTPRLDYSQKKKIAHFQGPVKIKQPHKTFTASDVTVLERENRTLFEDFHFQQDESEWLLEKGVVGSVPSQVRRDMDKNLTAQSRRAVLDRANKKFRMTGRVRVWQGEQFIRANKLTFDEQGQKLELFGRARVEDKNTQEFLQGEHLVYNQHTGRFEASGAVRLKIRLEQENEENPAITP